MEGLQQQWGMTRNTQANAQRSQTGRWHAATRADRTAIHRHKDSSSHRGMQTHKTPKRTPEEVEEEEAEDGVRDPLSARCLPARSTDSPRIKIRKMLTISSWKRERAERGKQASNGAGKFGKSRHESKAGWQSA
jgi:hypothetical protein